MNQKFPLNYNFGHYFIRKRQEDAIHLRISIKFGKIVDKLINNFTKN